MLVANLTDEQILEIVRNDPNIGRETLSMVEMCMTDEELIFNVREDNELFYKGLLTIEKWLENAYSLEEIKEDRIKAYDIMLGKRVD